MEKERRWVISRAAVLGVLILCSSVVSAQTISDIQYNLFGGDVFVVPGAEFNKEVFLYEDFSWDAQKVTGTMRISEDSGYYYEIRGGSINIGPSQLLADQSYTNIFNPLNRNVAQGYFALGASLTITGSIWHVVPGENPIEEEIFAEGNLLTGIIDLNFYVKEQDYQPNAMNSQLDIHVSGGELLNGSATGLQLDDNHIVADVLLVFCSQYASPGMNVRDFAGDISYLSPSMVQMYTAPEPFTVLFLSIGSVFMFRGKK